MKPFAVLLALLISAGHALLAAPATAHEMRPAYLDMQETRAEEFSVLWKVPARGDLRLGLYVELPQTAYPRRSRSGRSRRMPTPNAGWWFAAVA